MIKKTFIFKDEAHYNRAMRRLKSENSGGFKKTFVFKDEAHYYRVINRLRVKDANYELNDKQKKIISPALKKSDDIYNLLHEGGYEQPFVWGSEKSKRNKIWADVVLRNTDNAPKSIDNIYNFFNDNARVSLKDCIKELKATLGRYKKAESALASNPLLKNVDNKDEQNIVKTWTRDVKKAIVLVSNLITACERALNVK